MDLFESLLDVRMLEAISNPHLGDFRRMRRRELVIEAWLPASSTPQYAGLSPVREAYLSRHRKLPPVRPRTRALSGPASQCV